MPDTTPSRSGQADQSELLEHIAELELRVDRLRKQCQLIHHQAMHFLTEIQFLYEGQEVLSQESHPNERILENCRRFAAVLKAINDPDGYQLAHDVVIPIALKALVERLFRWQQRVWDAPQVVLRLELESASIDWFPLRFQQILENLISNAVRYRDDDKGEMRITFSCRVLTSSYELRLSDNGMGLVLDQTAETFDTPCSAADTNAANLGVDLSVAKLLIEQSGGTLTSDSNEGQGASIVAVLPRFDVDDFLEATSTPANT